MINKIIFYDGNMSDIPIRLTYFYVWAKDGYSHNQKFLENINEQIQEATVLTNDLFVWGNENVWWNGKENKCQAYILKEEVNGKWKEYNIQDLTDKELRKPHDIVKMYIAGVFNTNLGDNEDGKI